MLYGALVVTLWTCYGALQIVVLLLLLLLFPVARFLSPFVMILDATLPVESCRDFAQDVVACYST